MRIKLLICANIYVGDAVVEPERAVHTDDEWGGCWGCWNNHDRRRLLR